MSLRIWTAGLVAALPALGLRSGPPTSTEGFSLGLPLLVLCGGWLWHRSGREHFTQVGYLLLAFLFLVPVILTRMWNVVLAEDLMVYVDPVDHVRVAVRQASRCLEGLGALVGASGLALGLVVGRRAIFLCGALVGAGLGGTWMWWRLERVASALFEREGVRAMELAGWVEGAGVAGLVVGGGLAWATAKRFGAEVPGHPVFRLGQLLVLGTVAWQLRSPLPALLLPFPEAPQEGLPQGLPGVSVPLPILDPWADDFLMRAVELGQSEDSIPWHCSGRDRGRWLDVPRLAVALGAPARRTMEELDPVIERLYSRAIHRVVLVGQAHPQKGPLREALASPGIPMLLAAPPQGAHWLRIGEEEEWIWGGEPHGEDAICVLLPGADVEIGELYRTGRTLLEGGCEALALLPTPWREKFDGHLEADPGCHEKGQGPG